LGKAYTYLRRNADTRNIGIGYSATMRD